MALRDALGGGGAFPVFHGRTLDDAALVDAYRTDYAPLLRCCYPPQMKVWRIQEWTRWTHRGYDDGGGSVINSAAFFENPAADAWALGLCTCKGHGSVFMGGLENSLFWRVRRPTGPDDGSGKKVFPERPLLHRGHVRDGSSGRIQFRRRVEMSTGAGAAGAGAGAAAAAAAAVAQAIKASGVIVRVEPDVFLDLLKQAEEPLVVQATAGFFSTHYRYLFGWKGLAFYTRSATPLVLPGGCRVIQAKRIWIPG